MLSREAAGVGQRPRKMAYNTGETPWNRGDPCSDVAIDLLFRVGNLPIPPSAVIQWGGRVGLSSSQRSFVIISGFFMHPLNLSFDPFGRSLDTVLTDFHDQLRSEMTYLRAANRGTDIALPEAQTLDYRYGALPKEAPKGVGEIQI